MKGWLTVGVLLATMAYAIAEDLTLTTYYPSPRGVYDQLIANSGQFGAVTITSPSGDLTVTGNTILGDAATDWINFTASALDVPNNLSIDGGTLAIDAANDFVGIGLANPAVKLHVFSTSSTVLKLASGSDPVTADALNVYKGLVGWTLQPQGANQTVFFSPTAPGTLLLRIDGDLTVNQGVVRFLGSPVTINDGTQAAGNVLTSMNAAGQASWRPPAVITVTAIGGVQATATCPPGTVRVGCSGGREENLNDTCSEEDCGYIGTLPSGANGCFTRIDAGSETEATAVAYCLSF